MMPFKTYLLLFCLAISSQSIFGQKAELTLSTDSIMLGEQLQATITIQYEINEDSLQVIWPILDENLMEGIEIIELGKIDTIAAVSDDNPLMFEQTRMLTITSFDSGYYAIEPLLFIVSGLEVETNPELLSVYYPQVDMAGDIRDIKDIYSIRFTWKDWLALNWYWLVLGAMIITLLIWLYYSRKNRVIEEEEIVAAPKIIIPPHIIAFKMLDELELKKLWQNDKLKAYYTELTGIFREYLEKRFDILALEETSDEILQELRRKAISADLLEKIRDLLMLADLVKFAKEKPLPSEHDRAMRSTRDFIEHSKIREEESV